MARRSRRWSAQRHSGSGALEVGEILLGDGDGLRLVLDRDVDHAVGHLHAHRADFLGREHAEIAALDHRRAAHADRRVLRRDHHVAAAEQRGIAGEAAAGVDADQRRHAAKPAEDVEGHGVEAGHRLHVDVARPAAAAFGEEDQRQALLLDDLEQPVLLVMVGLALGAGQHRVVVVRDRAPGSCPGRTASR